MFLVAPSSFCAPPPPPKSRQSPEPWVPEPPPPSSRRVSRHLSVRVSPAPTCHDETASIQVDSRENHAMLVDFAKTYTPSVLARLHHYTG